MSHDTIFHVLNFGILTPNITKVMTHTKTCRSKLPHIWNYRIFGLTGKWFTDFLVIGSLAKFESHHEVIVIVLSVIAFVQAYDNPKSAVPQTPKKRHSQKGAHSIFDEFYFSYILT